MTLDCFLSNAFDTLLKWVALAHLVHCVESRALLWTFEADYAPNPSLAQVWLSSYLFSKSDVIKKRFRNFETCCGLRDNWTGLLI
jgi:hypothetical protein